MDALSGQVFEIIRGTTHDGPGLRTTVFLKGCPLRCLWCQNPEGKSARQEIWWEERKCIHCQACVDACPSEAVWEDEKGLHRDREKCNLCGACVEACPSLATSFTSRGWSLESLGKEVLKDKDYYDAFGGGVTVSGGEPLSQYLFVTEFFKRIHSAGVHTALDTCGLAPAAALASVLPHTDHVLFDIKMLDPLLHKKVTGQSNEIILQNLAFTADYIRMVNRERNPGTNHTMKLWIRTPLIPDTTATLENIISIGQFIQDHLMDVIERWELCAFNSACKNKYTKLGLVWTYADYPLLEQMAVTMIKEAALSSGIGCEKLVVSGLISRGK